MKIEDSVVIVTGAGSGIGHAIAESFATAGARVVVSDVNADDARSTAELITAAGHVAVPRQADACIEADIRALTALAAAEFGPVDIYVANAGVAGPPGLGLPECDWDHALEVNLHAHVRAASVLVPDWIERGGGHFVSIASAAGLLTQIGAAAYAVSKHAAVGFAEWLAIAYGDSGIGVSCVCPMGVNTPLLRSALESPDPLEQFMGRSIINAGPVIEPRLVAEVTLDAVRDGTFLALPQPLVRDLCQQKAADHDRWIEGMQQYRRSLTGPRP